MSWIQHPEPDVAVSEYGRHVLHRSLERNRGKMGIVGAMYTVPYAADHLLRFVDEVHFGETALPRVYKEMIATLVSSLNGCQY